MSSPTASTHKHTSWSTRGGRGKGGRQRARSAGEEALTWGSERGRSLIRSHGERLSMQISLQLVADLGKSPAVPDPSGGDGGGNMGDEADGAE